MKPEARGFVSWARKAIERVLGLESVGVDLDPGSMAGLWPGTTPSVEQMGPMAKAMLSSYMTADMPGDSYRGEIILSPQEEQVKTRLQEHINELAVGIGARNTNRLYSLERAARYIEDRLLSLGLDVRCLEYVTSEGHVVENIEAVIPGRDDSRSLVVGAHYDTVETPGANDNASGVACLLETARYLLEAGIRPKIPLRLVAFTNEEPPYFGTNDMGSRIYARSIKDLGERLVGMICLETLAYYSDDPGSQTIPSVVAPVLSRDRGDFLGFFSHLRSADFLKTVVKSFRACAEIPSEGMAASSVVQGITFSDHESFQRLGYPAIMVTDTAFLRYPYYHTPLDTPDKLEWTRFTKAATGVSRTVESLITMGV